ncbi:MAG: RNA polymerase sigma factor RpoE [Candidatus Eutrophobiaceae bacterium]
MSEQSYAKSGTDAVLVERVKQGDDRAYEVLCIRYQQRIISLAMRYVRNQSDAMDIAQETFVKAWISLKNFRGDSSFYTWLYRIAINTAKNHLISNRNQPANTNLSLSDGEQIEDLHTPKDQDQPDSLAIQDELHGIIAKAIDGLPMNLRTAITLREMEGLSYEEIALVMDCPIGTVRSRIFRAREVIDARLQIWSDGV